METSKVAAAVVMASEPGSLISRYAAQIAGQLGCFDRVVITGSLLDVCHAAALERRLQQADIRCFDPGLFAEPLRDAVRDHALTLARDAGLEVGFIPRKNFRQEDRIAELLARRGSQPGLVHVFSAMEPCPAFRPWHDKPSGRTGVKLTQGKCLHGLSNRLLQRVLTGKNGGQISRVLKRLRLHGLIKKIGHTYQYHVTRLGQRMLIAA